MPKIKIEDIFAEFDTKTGFIHLTTKDKRLKKKPFKIAVTGSTSTYESLLNLIESEISITKIQLPEVSETVSMEDLLAHDLDPRSSFNIGEDTFGVNQWNLQSAPHTLFHGKFGSGITFASSVIMKYADFQSQIQLYAADCSGIENEQKYYSGVNTKLAKTKDNILDMIDEVFELLEKRYSILEELEVSNFSDIIQMNSIFFVIDSLDSLELEETLLSNTIDKLNSILKLGRAAGVYLFVNVRDLHSSHVSKLNISNFERKVLSCNSRDFIMLNGKAPNWSGAYTRNIGRCIISTYGKQELVQLYHI